MINKHSGVWGCPYVFLGSGAGVGRRKPHTAAPREGADSRARACRTECSEGTTPQWKFHSQVTWRPARLTTARGLQSLRLWGVLI